MLRNVRIALCALLLTACQMTGREPAADINPITGDEITVMPLDTTVGEAAADDLPLEPLAEELPVDPVTEVEPAAEASPVQEAAPVFKSPEQIQCERRGGTWARAGKSEARTCVKQTRDGGKQCTKGTQCEGLCLARSGTCAPLAPLFGCNEILEDDGRRVTLCID